MGHTQVSACNTPLSIRSCTELTKASEKSAAQQWLEEDVRLEDAKTCREVLRGGTCLPGASVSRNWGQGRHLPEPTAREVGEDKRTVDIWLVLTKALPTAERGPGQLCRTRATETAWSEDDGPSTGKRYKPPVHIRTHCAAWWLPSVTLGRIFERCPERRS